MHEPQPKWDKDNSEITRRALHMAAAYRVHCACRTLPGRQLEQAKGAYWHRHMVRGSEMLISFVDNNWVGNHPAAEVRARPLLPGETPPLAEGSGGSWAGTSGSASSQVNPAANASTGST